MHSQQPEMVGTASRLVLGSVAFLSRRGKRDVLINRHRRHKSQCCSDFALVGHKVVMPTIEVKAVLQHVRIS